MPGRAQRRLIIASRVMADDDAHARQQIYDQSRLTHSADYLAGLREQGEIGITSWRSYPPRHRRPIVRSSCGDRGETIRKITSEDRSEIRCSRTGCGAWLIAALSS